MNWKPLAWLAGGVSAGMLIYGCLVEAERLVVRRETLRLRGWPKSKDGYRIALMADFHLRDEYTVDLTKRAVQAVLNEEPDVVVIAGDFVGYWKSESPWLIGEALEGLKTMAGRVLAVPGNHDYWAGDASLLQPICQELGIRLLRNQTIKHDAINWIGIDSLNARRADPSALCDLVGSDISSLDARRSTLESKPSPLSSQPSSRSTDSSALNAQRSTLGFQRTAFTSQPSIVIWHEPDAVRFLPDGLCNLMLSGHSHGGQFVFPGSLAPMTTKNGKKYRNGFYSNTAAPLFVTRGIGTTGPPARFLCPPEVVILELFGV